MNMNTDKKIKKITLIFCICVITATIILPILPIYGEGEIYDKTLRLHVIANSDSERDQALKLIVRDAVLAQTEELLKDSKTRYDAELSLKNNIELIGEAAKKAVLENGENYMVQTSVSIEKYPERSYESFKLPGGYYCSLVVRIGEGNGQNWWCVLFPPLCTGAASVKEELAAVGFSPSQIRLLTDSENPKYVLRFKILEWIEALF